MKLKLAVCVALAVILQSSLRALWPPLAYADLPLVVVAYFALQRDAVLAVVIGTVAGLGSDVLSNGLLGAGGFSKTLTAYVLAAVVTRVMIDNPLLRIPVLAGAAARTRLLSLPHPSSSASTSRRWNASCQTAAQRSSTTVGAPSWSAPSTASSSTRPASASSSPSAAASRAAAGE